MLINCPQCHFSREVTLSQLPENAVIATCPKCQSRFRFRDSDQDTSRESQKRIETLEYTSTINDYSQQYTNSKASNAYEQRNSDNSNDATFNEKTTYKTQNDNGEKLNNTNNSSSSRQKQEIDFSLIPWEHPEKFDFFSSFYQTIIRVMFYAPRFFGAISTASSSLLRPLFFYILLRLFQTLMDGMWFMVSFRAIEPSITESSVHDLLNSIAREMTLPVTLLITPLTFALQIYVYTLFFYIMIRLIQPEQAKFTTIFRVISYSAAPTIVCVIPIVGSLLGSIWFSISCFIGCKYALKLSWKKTTLALAPLYLTAIAIGMQGARQFIHFSG